MKTFFRPLLAGILAMLPLQQVHASTWDGGFSHADFTLNDFWTTANNWADGLPVSSSTTDIIFGLSSLRTTANQNIANPFALRSVTFAGNGNVTALTGSTLSVANGGTISQNSPISVSISTPIIVNTAATINGSGSGPLAMNGPINGSGTLRLVGSLGGPGLQVSLNAVNNFNGGLLIGQSAGGFAPVDVTLANNSAVGSGTLQFFNGNKIRASGGTRLISVPMSLSLNPNGLPSVFTFAAGGDLNFLNSIDVANSAKTLQVDNVLTTFAGSLSGSASLTKTGTGTLLLKGNNTAFGGSWVISGGVLKLTDSLSVPQTAVAVNTNGSFDMSAATTLSLTSLFGSGNLSLGNASLTLGANNFGSLFSGKISGSSTSEGALKKVGLGGLTLSGSGSAFRSLSAENGSLTLSGGSITLGGGLVIGNTLAAAPTCLMENGAILTCDPNAGSIVSGPEGTAMIMDGAGTFWNSGFQVVIGAGLGPGASKGKLTLRNHASASGTFMLVGAGNSSELGSLIIESGATINSAAGIIGFVTGSVGSALITDPGSVWQMQASLGMGGFSGAQLGGTGTLTVSNGATVSVIGSTIFWTPGNLINIDSGSLITGTLDSSLANATIAVSDPDETNSALTVGTSGNSSAFAGTILNSTTGPGSLTKTGGGILTLSGPLSYTGFTRVQGGTLRVTRSYALAGITRVSAGTTLEMTGVWGNNLFSTTTINPGGTLTGSGTLRGAVVNNGVIEVSAGKNLTFTGNVANNGRMRFKTGATFNITGSFTNNGEIDILSAGPVTFPPGFVNNGTIIDWRSLHTTITKVDTLVTITNERLYGGHFYTLQAGDSLDNNAFTTIGVPFLISQDRPNATDLGETGPQRFYRWKVD